MSLATPTKPGEKRRLDASMTLLLEVMESPLDPAYAAAAAKTSVGVAPSWRSRAVQFVIAVLIGIGLAMAITALRQPEEVRNQARDLLIEQVEQRTLIQEGLLAQNGELAEEIRQLSADQLSLSDPDALDELTNLGIASGAIQVAGEAYVITLTDSEQSQADPVQFREERVQAIDLQVVVNALWASGAEAISVNGTRVSGAGAIRGAGAAVLVDLVPVTSPYKVVASGNAQGIRSGTAATAASAHLGLLRDRYRIGVASAIDDAAWMPGISSTQIDFAKPIEPSRPTGSDGSGDDERESNDNGQQDSPDMTQQGGEPE